MSFQKNKQIIASEILYRAIHKNHWIEKEKRISSGLFKTNLPHHEISVDRDGGREEPVIVSFLLAKRMGQGVGKFPASVPIGLSLEVIADPLPDNDFHALIVNKDRAKITESIARKLSKSLILLMEPQK